MKVDSVQDSGHGREVSERMTSVWNKKCRETRWFRRRNVRGRTRHSRVGKRHESDHSKGKRFIVEKRGVEIRFGL